MTNTDDLDLPEGWQWTPLSAITIPVANIRPEDEPAREWVYADISSVSNESYRITDPKRFSGATAPSRARRPVQPFDTLFSNVRTYLRNIAMVEDTDGVDVCSTGFTVLRPNDAVDPRYLFRFTLTDAFIDRVTPEQTGTHYPATSDRVVLSQPIPLPPLAEQQRIVEKVEILLGRVQATRERLTRATLILKRFRQAVLTAAFNGQLTANWREANAPNDSGAALAAQITADRTKRFEELEAMSATDRPVALAEFDNLEPLLRDDIALPDLPAAWLWVDLRFLMSPEESFCYGVVQPGVDDGAGPRLIRVCDIEGGTVRAGSCRGITPQVHGQYSRSVLRGGEVLVSVVGTIGRSAVAPPATQGFNIARAVAKMPIRDFNERYVNYWLGSSLAQEWMIGDAREVARKTLNLEQLRTLPCPLPSLTEQGAIVRRVDALFYLADAIDHRIAAATAKTNKLTQAVLAKAFRGDLVPREADLARNLGREFESAEQLLKRIEGTAVSKTMPTKSKGRSKMGRSTRKATTAVKPLLDILQANGKPMSAEDLLTAAGYSDETIEDFYRALRDEVKNGVILDPRQHGNQIMLAAEDS
jgi:type I restriction enzyme, S subunit